MVILFSNSSFDTNANTPAIITSVSSLSFFAICSNAVLFCENGTEPLVPIRYAPSMIENIFSLNGKAAIISMAVWNRVITFLKEIAIILKQIRTT
jgi:hypothetical protein